MSDARLSTLRNYAEAIGASLEITLASIGQQSTQGIGVADMDEEQLQLGTSDQFWRLISERRQQRTISRAELERRLEARGTTRQMLTSTMTPAIVEPKADYTTNDE